jgi:hypothetical protein
MSKTITQSVGRGGINLPQDVRTIQELINNHIGKLTPLRPLTVDSRIGPNTIAAIEEFQRRVVNLARPDGRVDPGGRTLQALNAGGQAPVTAVTALVQLPQVGGNGYYSYEPANRQFGTPATIKALQDVAATFRYNMPDTEIGIGDISFAQGGTMSPHESHKHGRHVDIRPFRKDKAHQPVTITDAQYDRETTRLLVQSLLAHRNVKGILFNDAQIQGVQYYQGHHNHLHVKMKE